MASPPEHPEEYSAFPRSTGRRVGELLPSATLLSGREAIAGSCCSSAELVQPGDLFFLLDSGKGDDCQQAETALTRGAVAVVTERMLPLGGASQHGATQYQVANCREAFARCCHALVGEPSSQLSVIGIAGVSSPSIITRLLSPVLHAAGGTPAWWDGRWMSDADGRPADIGQEGSPALVASWLSRSVANGCSHAVASVMASNVEGRALAACGLEVLCLSEAPRRTNAEGSPAAARKQLADLIDQLRPGGVIVANATDATCCRLVAETFRAVLTYGLHQPADISGEVIERHNAGQTLLVRRGLESVAISTSVIGDAYAESCLAAVAVGVACGLSLEEVAKGIQSAPRPPGLLEPVVLGQEFSVYLDAADHLDCLRASASAIQRTTPARVLTVLVGEGMPASPQMLSAAAGKSDLVIATGTPSAGLAGRPDLRFVEEPFAAIALGIALAEPGDSLLIAGVKLDGDGQCEQSEVVRELIALRNANTPPARAA